MTARQIPNFLKRAAKRDSSSTSSSTSCGSASCAPRAFRFSSLGATDYDLFDNPPSPVPKHPLDFVDDKEEEDAQEALFSHLIAPPDAEEEVPEISTTGDVSFCTPARQSSISAPPEIQHDDELPAVHCSQSKEKAEGESDAELSHSWDSNTSAGKKEAKQAPVESCDLLDDIDKTFESVPKPASKPRKPPSAYAKPKQRVSVTKVPSDTAAPESLVHPVEYTAEPAEKGSARESVFDREEPAFEAELATAAREAPKPAEELPPRPASPPRSLPAPQEPTNGQRSSASSTPLASSTPATPPLPCAPEMVPPPASEQRTRSEFDAMALLLDRRMLVGAALMSTLVMIRLLPSASFLLGCFWGGLAALGASYLYRLLQTRTQPRDTFRSVPELRDLQPPNVPHIADEPDDGDGIFRGWLNELNVYVPDSYHINQTSSVYVSLDGTQLRIQRPKQSVQKRAMWNEVLPSGSMSFIHQRHFEMMGAKVTLEPTGLVKKRVWSKKYPICIEVSVGNVVGATASSRGAPKTSTGRHPKPAQPADDFEWVDEKEASSERFYLFARTCREKEEWYRRFEAAAKGKPLQLSLKRIVNTHLEEDRNSVFAASNAGAESAAANSGAVSYSALSGASGTAGASGSESSGGGIPGPAEPWSDRLPGKDREPLAVTYTRYMARFMPADWLMKAAKSHRLSINHISCDPQVLWLNAILGRAVWDFLREKFWADTVKQKIQNKLRKIHLPYFIDELSVVEISLGQDFPVIRRAGKPFLDRRGLWVELEIAYCGGSSMALETKVNLMKLRRPKHEAAEARSGPDVGAAGAQGAAAAGSVRSCGNGEPALPRRHHQAHHGAFCSEEEDSAESTTDSELDENPEADIVTDPDKGNHVGGGTSRKLLRFVDRISRSSYFHKAIENKFIQRGMEYVSNTRIVLHVEVRGLSGTLMINIPPPPTDRLWYGFKPCPKLILAARPKVGAKELTMNRLTEWIEKKLELEFHRIFVLPNMDDLVVPLLLSGNPECAHHPDATPFSKP